MNICEKEKVSEQESISQRGNISERFSFSTLGAKGSFRREHHVCDFLIVFSSVMTRWRYWLQVINSLKIHQ